MTDPNRTSPEPEIFQRYWNSLAKSIHQLVEGEFTLLLGIAVENNLEKPIEWARSQARLMLEDELLVEDLPAKATRLRDWIVCACDGRDRPGPPSADKAAFEAWLFYRDWQSPAWLHMKPLGNSRYDPELAWGRDDVEGSQRVLAFHAELMWLAIRDRLQRLAGAAHVKTALIPSPMGKQTKAPESADFDGAKAFRARASPPPASKTESGGEHFLWKGEVWEVSYQHKTAILKDSKGMRFLAVLLHDPRKSFDARELYQLVAAVSGQSVELEAGDRPLDDKAKAEVQGKYEELKIREDSALTAGDVDLAAAIEEEMEELANHLAEQRRLYSPQSERARKNIGNQLESVISRIAHNLPELAVHLRESLKKGRFVSYQADLQWNVALPPPPQNPRS